MAHCTDMVYKVIGGPVLFGTVVVDAPRAYTLNLHMRIFQGLPRLTLIMWIPFLNVRVNLSPWSRSNRYWKFSNGWRRAFMQEETSFFTSEMQQEVRDFVEKLETELLSLIHDFPKIFCCYQKSPWLDNLLSAKFWQLLYHKYPLKIRLLRLILAISCNDWYFTRA